jgi:endoglucanase
MKTARAVTAAGVLLLSSLFQLITVTAQAADAPATASTPKLSVRVKGNRLIDAQGQVLQVRGVNVSGLEFTHIDGTTGPDDWGGQRPDFNAIKAWNVNAIRVPLNEASYLGYTTYDMPQQGGARAQPRNPDPTGRYKKLVREVVDEATSRGYYVILDLHKNAPKATMPGFPAPVPISPRSQAQNEMADADYSVAFWRAVATDFKADPNVIFDLFNEPHIDNFEQPSGTSDWRAFPWVILRDGGTGKIFYGADAVIQQRYKSAGMQSLVDAVRSTGATNVVMVSGISWAQDLSRWLEYVPKDPLKQLACSWHAYPKYGAKFGTPEYNDPGMGPQTWGWMDKILAAGYPVIIGETGDQSANGTKSAPFLTRLLPWADKNSVSVVGWSWNAWGSPDHDLIKDPTGTPTDGYGEAFRDWLKKHR